MKTWSQTSILYFILHASVILIVGIQLRLCQHMSIQFVWKNQQPLNQRLEPKSVYCPEWAIAAGTYKWI